MATRKAAVKGRMKSTKATGDVVEDKLVAFAEQLGWLMGTVRAKADGWLDPKVLKKEVGRIRDGAADLLKLVNREYEAGRQAGARQEAAPAPRPSRGPVDAPGKRHRKPPPQERIDRHMGEPIGKKMGQKSLKNARGRGRG